MYFLIFFFPFRKSKNFLTEKRGADLTGTRRYAGGCVQVRGGTPTSSYLRVPAHKGGGGTV